jgi:hypothetical protein
MVGNDQTDGHVLLLGRELGEAALVFLDRPQPGKLAALHTGEHVRMLPEHRFGQHVGFSGRQQMAHRAQQRRFENYRRCEQTEQLFDRRRAVLGGSSSRRCACRRAAQQAMPVPFDDLEAALQTRREQLGGNRTEDQRRARGAAQAAAEPLPAEQRFGGAVEQAEVAENQQGCRRRRHLPVLRRALQRPPDERLPAGLAGEHAPIESELAVALFERAAEAVEIP